MHFPCGQCFCRLRWIVQTQVALCQLSLVPLSLVFYWCTCGLLVQDGCSCLAWLLQPKWTLACFHTWHHWEALDQPIFSVRRHYCWTGIVDWTCTVVLSHFTSWLVPYSLPHNKNGGPKQREQTRVTGCVLGLSRRSPVEKIPKLIFWMPSLDLGLHRWGSFWHLT